jgi:hypothetical protein
LDDSLEGAMIGFDDIVQVFTGPVFCAGRQLALALQPADRFRVGTEFIGGDRGRRPVAHGRQRFSQETMGCPSIATVCQHEINQAAMLVEGSKQVLPPAANFHIRLVHAPGGGSIALVLAHSFLQLRRITMHPAHKRRRAYFHAALLHYLHEIPIADAVLAIPANTKQDDLNGKAPTLEHSSSYRLSSRCGLTSHRLMQQCPHVSDEVRFVNKLFDVFEIAA